MKLKQIGIIALVLLLWGAIGIRAWFLLPFLSIAMFDWFLFGSVFVFAPLFVELVWRMIDYNRLEKEQNLKDFLRNQN